MSNIFQCSCENWLEPKPPNQGKLFLILDTSGTCSTSKSYLSSECEIIVREHDAFGHAGSSGGVDKVATLVDSDPFETIFQFVLVLLLTDLEQFLPAQDTLLGRGTQVLNNGFKL